MARDRGGCGARGRGVMSDGAPAGQILFVDDDVNILEAFQRQFRKRFSIHTADGPRKGLDLISANGPYAVIVSDLCMTGMTGIQFLSKTREASPDSVRILLTG